MVVGLTRADEMEMTRTHLALVDLVSLSRRASDHHVQPINTLGDLTYELTNRGSTLEVLGCVSETSSGEKNNT
jgi:hypothetical protein